ncbi:MAG: lysophospholipid acyltransferase family protein [Alistipes sp.]|nr:lysophospholipid acyltransferase family protein [Alistipes sp.]
MKMVNSVGLTFWQRIRLGLLWYISLGVATSPYFVQYHILQGLVCFVLRCIRYRYSRITSNLHNSFPEKSEAEIRTIRRRFYSHLAEMIVNTLGQARMTPEECRRRLNFVNSNELLSVIGNGPGIVLTSHLGSWEYYGFYGAWVENHVIALIYHKLHDPAAEELLKRLRIHSNGYTVASHEAARFFTRYRNDYNGKPVILGLISDQNPPRTPDSHWYRFLNQDTIFFEGGERLAMRYGVPVFYASQRKLRRGYYEATFEMLWDGVSEVAPHEITERYVSLLERDILACPEMWMWSHHRWKHRPDKKYNPVARPRGY